MIVGLGLILAGANFLTDGSAALAQRFRVPEFIIGLTVVAVGTSTPELVVSVLSAIGGQSDVAIGNVVGSNIFNVFVILGVCALIRPVPLTAGNIRRDIPFGVLVSLLLLALAQDSLLCKGAADRIGRLDGAAMLALYILLMWYTIRKTKRPEATAPTEGSKAPMAAWLTAVMIVGGLAGLVFGGREHLVDLFDSILWSAANLNRMADPAAGYFSAVEGSDTLFALEQASQALEQLSTLVEGAVPEEALSWTEDQAVEAFVSGEAIALIAGQDRMEEIASALGEEALGVAGYPRGLSGIAITGLEYTGFGVAADSRQAGNAVHFLTYLSNSDNNTHLAKVCGTVPIHTTAADLEPSLEEGNLAVNMEMVRRANWYYYAQEPQMYQAQEGWRDIASGALGEYLSGKLSQQELLEEFDSYWSKALEDEGALWETESEE